MRKSTTGPWVFHFAIKDIRWKIFSPERIFLDSPSSFWSVRKGPYFALCVYFPVPKIDGRQLSNKFPPFVKLLPKKIVGFLSNKRVFLDLSPFLKRQEEPGALWRGLRHFSETGREDFSSSVPKGGPLFFWTPQRRQRGRPPIFESSIQ